MHTISARNINPLNNYIHDKNDSTEESNQISLKDLKNTIDELEMEKLDLNQRIEELKERVIDLNIVKNEGGLKSLEKEREDMKIKATNSLELCSKLAEELIILRDKLDKYNHNKK